MANNETVEQVCEEMHGVKTGQHANGGRLYERYMMKCQIAEEYADRILAAHKRDMEEKDAEIEKLRAALKPVLECDCWIFETAKSRATDGATDAIKAVLEAQRIYKEVE